MTQELSSTQGTAVDQLKQLLKDKVSQGAGAAATIAGQQAGVMAQAVRQAGEELRQQGSENQGKIADRVAQPVQRLSASLTHFDPQTLNLDPKQIRPQLTSQAQKVKARAGDTINTQVTTRAEQAGLAMTALTDGIGLTGEQLRAQGQQVPALVLDAFAEKLEPLADYIASANLSTVRTDLAVRGQQVKAKLSTAAGAVTKTQKKTSTKGLQVVKQTASGFRQSPVLPAVGALVVAVALAARKGVKAGSTPKPTAEPAPKPTPPLVDGGTKTASPTTTSDIKPASDLDGLSRSQLQERAMTAGISVHPEMTKSQLRDLLEG